MIINCDISINSTAQKVHHLPRKNTPFHGQDQPSCYEVVVIAAEGQVVHTSIKTVKIHPVWTVSTIFRTERPQTSSCCHGPAPYAWATNLRFINFHLWSNAKPLATVISNLVAKRGNEAYIR